MRTSLMASVIALSSVCFAAQASGAYDPMIRAQAQMPPIQLAENPSSATPGHQSGTQGYGSGAFGSNQAPSSNGATSPGDPAGNKGVEMGGSNQSAPSGNKGGGDPSGNKGGGGALSGGGPRGF